MILCYNLDIFIIKMILAYPSLGVQEWIESKSKQTLSS